jgi:hypothetical protein
MTEGVHRSSMDGDGQPSAENGGYERELAGCLGRRTVIDLQASVEAVDLRDAGQEP